MGRKSNAAIEARKLARERRVKMDSARDARDRRVEDAAAAVFVTKLDRAEALAAVDAADRAMAGSVRGPLADEGLTHSQVAELLDLDAAEVRRLAKLEDQPSPAGAAGAVEAGASKKEGTAGPAGTARVAAAADEQVARS